MAQAPTMTDFGSPTSAPGEPERTSILALLSMISSIICCIPGLSILGTLMGIGALVTIGGSNGRVGGRGMAWTGVIVGVLVTMLWGGLLIGGASAAREMVSAMTAMEPSFKAIDSGDYASARQMLSAGTQASATDEAFEAFRTAYQAQLGTFDSIPPSLGQWWDGWMANGQTFQAYQGQQFIPLVFTFENGTDHLVFMMMDPGAQPSGADPSRPLDGMFKNIIIPLPDGTEARLIP